MSGSTNANEERKGKPENNISLSNKKNNYN